MRTMILHMTQKLGEISVYTDPDKKVTKITIKTETKLKIISNIENDSKEESYGGIISTIITDSKDGKKEIKSDYETGEQISSEGEYDPTIGVDSTDISEVFLSTFSLFYLSLSFS